MKINRVIPTANFGTNLSRPLHSKLDTGKDKESSEINITEFCSRGASNAISTNARVSINFGKSYQNNSNDFFKMPDMLYPGDIGYEEYRSQLGTPYMADDAHYYYFIKELNPAKQIYLINKPMDGGILEMQYEGDPYNLTSFGIKSAKFMLPNKSKPAYELKQNFRDGELSRFEFTKINDDGSWSVMYTQKTPRNTFNTEFEYYNQDKNQHAKYNSRIPEISFLKNINTNDLTEVIEQDIEFASGLLDTVPLEVLKSALEKVCLESDLFETVE